jgi:hypothetical protein
MSALVFLLIVIVVSGIGSLVLWLRYRSPTGLDSGIEAFKREMGALAPPDEPGPGPRDGTS